MGIISVIAGVAVLVAAALDVFTTVFVPRGGAGWLTERLYRRAWTIWSAIACAGGRRRRGLLAVAGPFLLPLTIAVWVAELVLGFALIYLPFADDLASTGDEQSTTNWVSALYVSGYSATTLGVGDVYATTGPLRLLITLEGAIGFALFTVSITYLLSVYNALQVATSFALSITTFLGRRSGEDGVDVVCRAIRSGSESETVIWLGQTIAQLAETSQAQRQYPLIAYFHIPDDHRAPPVALCDLLLLLTVCRALLDPDEHPKLSSSATTVATWRGACDFVTALGGKLGTGTVGGAHEARADQQYCDARSRLEGAGVAVLPDAAARAQFRQLHGTWATGAQQLLAHFHYRAS